MSSLNPNKRKPSHEPVPNGKRSTGADLTGLRLPVHDLMAAIRTDEGLRETLEDEDWERLDAMRAEYDAGTIDRRGLVDGFSEVVGGTMKLFALVKLALSKNADVAAMPSPAPVLPLRIALQRMSSTTSSVSSASTPGGAEVSSILGPNRGYSRDRQVSTSEPSSPDIRMLVHSFHCNDDECTKPKCRELKLILQRMESHVEQCPASRTPLGPLSKECKTCRLWKTLTRTRNGSVSAGATSAPPQQRRSSPLAPTLR